MAVVQGRLPLIPDDCCPGVPELVPLLHRCRQMEPDQVSAACFSRSLCIQTQRPHVVTTQRPTFAEINAELNALDFTKQQTERGEQQGPPIPRPRGKTSAVSAGATETIVHDGFLVKPNQQGKLMKRFYQLVRTGGSNSAEMVLMLRVCKKDPNPGKMQPPPPVVDSNITACYRISWDDGFAEIPKAASQVKAKAKRTSVLSTRRSVVANAPAETHFIDIQGARSTKDEESVPVTLKLQAPTAADAARWEQRTNQALHALMQREVTTLGAVRAVKLLVVDKVTKQVRYEMTNLWWFC
jgi:hypothetical protein